MVLTNSRRPGDRDWNAVAANVMGATFSYSTCWCIEIENELVWTAPTSLLIRAEAPMTLDKGFLVVVHPPAQARENSTSSSAPAVGKLDEYESANQRLVPESHRAANAERG